MPLFKGFPWDSSAPPAGDKSSFLSKPPAGGSAVPPPPPTSMEVSVRTMATDLENMGKSLEEALREMTTAAPMGQAAQPLVGVFGAPAAQPAGDKIKLALWGLVVIVGVMVFFFAGYFFLPLIFKEPPPEEAAPAAPAAVNELSPPTPVFLGHRSFLRKPPAATLKFEFSRPLTPAYYNLYRGAVGDILAAAEGKDLVEIVLQKGDGQAVAWTQMLALFGIGAIDGDFWNSRLERDFTFLAWRENNAWRPVYVLKLNPGQNPLVLQSILAKMETDPNLKNFFLDPPGGSGDTFRDYQVIGQPVRLKSWENGEVLLYGWLYSQYLVISTSEAGFRETMLRL